METPKKFVLKSGARQQKYATILAGQVAEILQEWYANLGQTVPPDELKVCREIDAAELAEAIRIEAAAAKESSKPVYGTPEFWKAYWVKKRGQGAPPPKVKAAKQTPATLKCAKSSSQAGHK